MKLKNKKTGEIIDVYKGQILLHYNQGKKTIQFKSIEELEDWEDYEEPKEYWYMSNDGAIIRQQIDEDTPWDVNRREIGNYFETKEEAEKAVEKLKAVKRLKDKGFRFLDHIDRDCGQGLTRYEWSGYIDGEDLDLLFGDD